MKLLQKIKAKGRASNEENELEINFAVGQVAKNAHGTDIRYHIPPMLAKAIVLIKRLLCDRAISLSTPIDRIVERDVDLEVGADTCKRDGGGWSTDLHFWWHLEFPTEVQRRAHLPNNKTKTGCLISINKLEMICVIINLAAVIRQCIGLLLGQQ